MQQIGPFLAMLPNLENSGQLLPHWCYITIDDAGQVSSLKAVVANVDGDVPDRDADTLILRNDLSVPVNVSMLPTPYNVGHSKPACLAISKDALYLYSYEPDAHIEGFNCLWWYSPTEEARESRIVTIPSSDSLHIAPSNFIPLDGTQYEQQYTKWFATQFSQLSDNFQVFLKRNHDESLISKIQFWTELAAHLHDNTSNDYLIYTQLYYYGCQVTLHNKLHNEVTTLLNTVKPGEFDSTLNSLLKQGWSPKSLAIYASLFRNLADKLQLTFITNSKVQEQISTLLAQDFQLSAFTNCNRLAQSIILNIPEVANQLRTTLNSPTQLDEFAWRTKQRQFNVDYYTTHKDALVEILGLQVVAKRIVDESSLSLVNKNTSRTFFCQLIWNNLPLFAKTLSSDHALGEALTVLFSNQVDDDQAKTKLTEFVDALPESLTLGIHTQQSLKAILTDTTVSEEQKRHFLQLPRIQSLITYQVFFDMHNSGGFKFDGAAILYEALFPLKIREFVTQSNGNIFKILPLLQKMKARTLFTDEELKHNHYFKVENCNYREPKTIAAGTNLLRRYQPFDFSKCNPYWFDRNQSPKYLYSGLLHHLRIMLALLSDPAQHQQLNAPHLQSLRDIIAQVDVLQNGAEDNSATLYQLNQVLIRCLIAITNPLDLDNLQQITCLSKLLEGYPSRLARTLGFTLYSCAALLFTAGLMAAILGSGGSVLFTILVGAKIGAVVAGILATPTAAAISAGAGLILGIGTRSIGLFQPTGFAKLVSDFGRECVKSTSLQR